MINIKVENVRLAERHCDAYQGMGQIYIYIT